MTVSKLNKKQPQCPLIVMAEYKLVTQTRNIQEGGQLEVAMGHDLPIYCLTP